MAKEGIGTVQMSLNGTPEYYSYPEPNSTVLYLEYDTTDSKQDYSVAWDNYFTKTLNMNPPTIVGSKRTYILPTDTNRPVTLIIKKFEVEIKSI